MYARLVAQCQASGDPGKAQEALDADLYAPLAGWDAADRKLHAMIDAAAGRED